MAAAAHRTMMLLFSLIFLFARARQPNIEAVQVAVTMVWWATSPSPLPSSRLYASFNTPRWAQPSFCQSMPATVHHKPFDYCREQWKTIFGSSRFHNFTVCCFCYFSLFFAFACYLHTNANGQQQQQRKKKYTAMTVIPSTRKMKHTTEEKKNANVNR